MKGYMKRIQIESGELQERIEKLQTFVGTKEYHLLPKGDAMLLDSQMFSMMTYQTILRLRMENYINA